MHRSRPGSKCSPAIWPRSSAGAAYVPIRLHRARYAQNWGAVSRKSSRPYSPDRRRSTALGNRMMSARWLPACCLTPIAGLTPRTSKFPAATTSELALMIDQYLSHCQRSRPFDRLSRAVLPTLGITVCRNLEGRKGSAGHPDLNSLVAKGRPGLPQPRIRRQGLAARKVMR